MAAIRVLGVLFILGLSQASVIPKNGHTTGEDYVAEIETLRSGSGARIVAGWVADDGQFPHQISLRMVNGTGVTFSCGGSIIHHNWVITAAHCVANRFSFVVRFGLTNVTTPEYIVDTTRYYIYPDYYEPQAGVQTDDIALVGLDHHIPYGPNIQPIRIQNSGQKNTHYVGVVLTVSGYGLTDDSWNGGSSSEVLRWVHLKGIDTSVCRDFYGGSTIIQQQTLCAESYNDTAQSTCQGDSGGPVYIVDDDGLPTLVGVVSFGHISGCNSPFPSAHVRPEHYHNWIEDITGINFDWDTSSVTPDDTRTPVKVAAL